MAMSRRMRRELKRSSLAQKKPFRPEKKAPPPAKRRISPVKFLREVRVELSRVNWPTRAELLSSTLVVIVTVLIITAIIYLFDIVFSNIVSLLAK